MSKLRWYQRGAKAAAVVFQGLAYGYVCPLCGEIFPPDRIDELSREHVPPEALGGVVLVLTCAACNSITGHEIDAHAVRNARVRELIDGSMSEESEPLRGRAYLEDGYRLDARLRNTGGGIRTDGLIDLLGPPRPDSTNITLRGPFRRWQIQSGDATRETASWLKSAYLVAFAALGYRYFELPGLDKVREWIQQPEKANDEVYHLHVEGISEHQRGLVIVPAHGSPEAIAVQFGTRVMFLPGTEKGTTFYARLHNEDFRKRLIDPSRDSKLIGWPTEPMHLLDH